MITLNSSYNNVDIESEGTITNSGLGVKLNGTYVKPTDIIISTNYGVD